MKTIDMTIDGFHFRSIMPQDKEEFMLVRSETSEVSAFYKAYPDFLDYNWNEILQDQNELNMVVFQEPYELFIGTCSFQRLKESKIILELGYNIVKDHRCKGIGSKMVSALIQVAHHYYPYREIYIKVRESNIASRRIAEKCGGILVGLTDAPEVETMQSILPSIDDLQRAECVKAVIAQGKNAVRVYKV